MILSYVAVADDNPLIRYLLYKRLGDIEGYHLIIEGINGLDLINKIKTSARIPHICILDIGMPELNGYEVMNIIRKKWPGIKVLIFSEHHHIFSIATLIKLGVRGFLSKDDCINHLEEALINITEEGYYYSKYATKIMFENILAGKLEQPVFTPIEIKLLQLFCQDLHYSEIAEKLGVSTHTIEKHKQNISSKTGINSRIGLVIFTLQNELLTLH